jgi:hypothetical protein
MRMDFILIRTGQSFEAFALQVLEVIRPRCWPDCCGRWVPDGGRHLVCPISECYINSPYRRTQ